jgi:hypothetical protein
MSDFSEGLKALKRFFFLLRRRRQNAIDPKDFEHAVQLQSWFRDIAAAWEGFTDISPAAWELFCGRIERVCQECGSYPNRSPRFAGAHGCLESGLEKLRKGCSYPRETIEQAAPHLNAGFSIVQRAMLECAEANEHLSRDMTLLSESASRLDAPDARSTAS